MITCFVPGVNLTKGCPFPSPAWQQLNPGVLVPMHYRLADLEPDPEGPDDLGGIDGWLQSRHNVRRLATHRTTISPEDQPGDMEIVVFDHWPALERPQDGE